MILAKRHLCEKQLTPPTLTELHSLGVIPYITVIYFKEEITIEDIQPAL